MHVKVLTRQEEFEAIIPQLADLEQFAELSTQSTSWLQSATELHPEGNLRVFVVWEGDEIVAAATLARVRVRLIYRWLIVGSHHHYEPYGLLYRTPEALDALIEALAAANQPLLLSKISDRQIWLTDLQTLLKKQAYIRIRPAGGAPVLALHEGWTRPLQQLSSRRRSDLKRAYRRAHSLGDVSVEILTPAVEFVDHLVERAIKVEAKSWKTEAGTALSSRPERAAFFKAFARHAAADGTLRISFLTINGADAAMQIAVSFQGAWWVYKIGYDSEFSACSPGIILMSETISAAAGAGLKRFEFMGKDDPWIKMWTRETHDLVTIRTYPHTLQGLAAVTADVCVRLSVRLKEAILPTQSSPA